MVQGWGGFWATGAWGSLIEAVGSRNQPPGPNHRSPTEVLAVFSETDLPRELPRGRFHAPHNPAGCPPARLPTAVCKTQITHQDPKKAGPRPRSLGTYAPKSLIHKAPTFQDMPRVPHLALLYRVGQEAQRQLTLGRDGGGLLPQGWTDHSGPRQIRRNSPLCHHTPGSLWSRTGCPCRRRRSLDSDLKAEQSRFPPSIHRSQPLVFLR